MCDFCKEQATHKVIRLSWPKTCKWRETIRCDYHTQVARNSGKIENVEVEISKL